VARRFEKAHESRGAPSEMETRSTYDPLGFEIGNGQTAWVKYPSEGHLAWFGQTQLSGQNYRARGDQRPWRTRKPFSVVYHRGRRILTGRIMIRRTSAPTNDEEHTALALGEVILESQTAKAQAFRGLRLSRLPRSNIGE